MVPDSFIADERFLNPVLIAAEWETEASADRHCVVVYGAQRIAPGARETVDTVFRSLDIVKLRI